MSQLEDDIRGSVSMWLDGLREDDSVAQQQVWERYFRRLVGVARRRLGTLARDTDGEDEALLALNTVMVAVRDGQYPNLADRDDLWKLLVYVTVNNSLTEVRRQTAQRRSPQRELRPDDLEQLLGAEPTVEAVAELSEELNRLKTATERLNVWPLVERKLAGHTTEEIAEEFDCSTRTVRRKLAHVRQVWLGEDPDD